MKLRHLRVRHFRCIRALDWLVAGDFMCLVGPGDVGKSTVLDAIEFVLSPRWNLTFDDADFHEASHAEPIVIEATLGELHRRLQSDAHFGLRLRGLSADGTIHDEPEESDEPVITVRLAVDSSLEPSWEVVTDRHPEGMPIHARERESFAAIRLGAVIERQLSWSRGSSLARLTGDAEEHGKMLADAGRSARASVDVERLPKLKAAAAQVALLSKVFGVRPRSEFGPGLDAANATLGTGGLALHDGLIPLRRAGLGTRRLVTLAIQREVSQSGGVLLIDEVENGLEPFRVRRLLRELRTPTPAAPQEPASDDRTSRVVVTTSHSSVALGELRAEELRIVRPSTDGIVLLTPPAAAQGVLRAHAEAFLSERVIVTEGKTELGLLRGLDDVWAKTGEPFAFRGIALADGGGCSKISGVARVFLDLRYPTAVIADSDQPIDDPEGLRKAGALVLLWEGKVATEERIFLDLPWEGVEKTIELACELWTGDHVRNTVATALKTSPKNLPAALGDWRGFRKEDEIRASLGQAAKSGDGWFKRVDRAAALGRIVAAHLGAAAGTDLATKLQSLKTWCLS
jgi:hypothetical protein